MMRTPRVVQYLLAVLALGCGGASGSTKGSVHVLGVVTLDGKPFDGATVTFSGAENQSSGKTNKDGQYELAQDLPPGEYRVTVRKFSGTFQAGDGMDEGQLEAMAGAPGSPTTKDAPTQLVPEPYSDLGKTTLKFVVPESTKTAEANIRLTR